MKGIPTGVISHWYVLFEDFNTSALEFYAAVEEAVKRREVPEAEIERVTWKEGGFMSAEREYLRVKRGKHAFDICAAPFGNGFFFSWWFAKLPAEYGIFAVLGVIALCLFFFGLGELVLLNTFGTSCFGIFSQGLFIILGFPGILLLLGFLVHKGALADEDWVLSLPILGPLYAWAFNPLTYYRADTALMFQEAVRAAVNEIIAGLRNEKGLRALSEEEWRPRLRDMAR